ncbi:MAG: YcxB family protein [Chloroflexota bacterium]|nr:hypothetical protein [Dehalococcoidia bacterium]MDW8253558.1 YcxB family protein [Chloroflexota bacterium]
MLFAVQLTEDDLAALAAEQRRFQRRRSTALQIFGRTTVAIWFLFFAGLALIAAATLALLPGAGIQTHTLLIVGGAALLWLLLFAVVLPQLRQGTVRGVIREELSRDGAPHFQLEVEEGGMRVRSRYGDLRFGWGDVRTVIEASERLFFFVPLDIVPFGHAIVFPLRGLSAEERANVFALLERHRSRFAENEPADIGTR